MVPCSASAVSSSATAPGGVTEAPPRAGTASWPDCRSPSVVNSNGTAPEPSRAAGAPVPSCTNMNPSPPTPQDWGSTTYSTKQAVTAASTALPPSESTSTAAPVARGSEVATAAVIGGIRSVAGLGGGHSRRYRSALVDISLVMTSRPRRSSHSSAMSGERGNSAWLCG